MSQNFNAKLFDELDPCYPDMDLSSGVEKYRVTTTNGTYAGVNIILNGLTPGIPVAIMVSGDTTAFKLFEMIPVPVEVNTGTPARSEYLSESAGRPANENVIRRAPFMVYEALQPIFNIVMANTTTMGLNFKTIVEYVKENTVSDFSIAITQGEQTITLVLEVEKYTFTVPTANKDTHKFINWFSFGAIAQSHNIEKWSELFYTMLGKYLRVAQFTRQNMLALPYNEFFIIEDNMPKLHKERLKRVIDIAKAQGICYFQGSAVCHRASGLEDDNDFYNSLDHSTITHSDEVAKLFLQKAGSMFSDGTKAVDSFVHKIIPGDGEDVIRSVCKQMYDFVVENNLQDSYMQCALDEPDDALSNTYKTITDIVRENMPNIPILEPVLPTEKVKGCLDIWCPSTDVYEKNQKFFDDRVAEGGKLFVYTCLTPGANYCNRLLDFERLRIVYLSWAPAKYPNIEGFLHWGANQYTGQDPFARSAAMFSEQVLEFHPKRAMFLPAGDNCIFYPGKYEPLISIRSEAHRIGYEDLVMLEQLAKIDSAKAEQIVQKVFRTYSDYEKSVEAYREVRKELIVAVST